MTRWMKIEDSPAAWEGTEVWVWKEWHRYVEPYIIPVGFSRESHHCRGVYIHKFTRPAAPKP